MIKLERGTKPRQLEEKGPQSTAELIQAFDSNLDLNFKPLYKHLDVKECLLKQQNSKCAYCENTLLRHNFHVEHFRPKSAFRQDENSEEIKPGYFWLAYEWTNLLLSCDVCNTNHKGILFPLEDPNSRTAPDTRDLATENPLLINPYEIDPRIHFEFKTYNILPKTTMGKISIKTYGLSEAEGSGIRELRKDVFFDTEILVFHLENPPYEFSESLAAVLHMLASRLLASNKFSAMVRDNFETRIYGLFEKYGVPLSPAHLSSEG